MLFVVSSVKLMIAYLSLQLRHRMIKRLTRQPHIRCANNLTTFRDGGSTLLLYLPIYHSKVCFMYEEMFHTVIHSAKDRHRPRWNTFTIHILRGSETNELIARIIVVVTWRCRHRQ